MDPARFVRRNTAIAAPPLVPELALHLATRSRRSGGDRGEPGRGAAAAAVLGLRLGRRPGAGALPARHPAEVAGRAVLDFATGSGIVAIAAAKAGARRGARPPTSTRSPPPRSLNAALNGVAVELHRRRPARRAAPPAADRPGRRHLLRGADGASGDGLAARRARGRDAGADRRSGPRLSSASRAWSSWPNTGCRPAASWKTPRAARRRL